MIIPGTLPGGRGKVEKMKYDVRFSCGHEGTLVLFGKNKDREWRIKEAEEGGLCAECWALEQEKKRQEMGLVLDVGLNFDPLTPNSKPVILSFIGDTKPHKDVIKELGYRWGEMHNTNGLLAFTLSSGGFAWYKMVELEDLKEEMSKAEGIGAKLGKMPTDTQMAEFVGIQKIKKDKEAELKSKIEKLEKPEPPQIWKDKIEGKRCNRTIYGYGETRSVYVNGEKVGLDKVEAAALKEYWDKKSAWEKAVKELTEGV